MFPTDGAILVPGPIAMTKDCPNPAGAAAVYDFLLSTDGQRAMVDADMYSVLPGVPPPHGAPALDTIPVRPWMPGFLDDVVAHKSDAKQHWAALAGS